MGCVHQIPLLRAPGTFPKRMWKECKSQGMAPRKQGLLDQCDQRDQCSYGVWDSRRRLALQSSMFMGFLCESLILVPSLGLFSFCLFLLSIPMWQFLFYLTIFSFLMRQIWGGFRWEGRRKREGNGNQPVCLSVCLYLLVFVFVFLRWFLCVGLAVLELTLRLGWPETHRD